jgi:hypothetical protein
MGGEGGLCEIKYSIEMYIELDVRQTTESLFGTRLRQWRFSNQHMSERVEGNHTVFRLHLMLTKYSIVALYYCKYNLDTQEYVS